KVRDRFVKKHVRRVQLAEGQTPDSVHASAAVPLVALPGRALHAGHEEHFCSRVASLLDRPQDEKAIPSLDLTVAQALDVLALSLRLNRAENARELEGWRSLRELKDLDFEHGLVHHVRPIVDLPEAIE